MSTPALRAEVKTLQLREAFRIAHGTSHERQVLRLYWQDALGEAPFVPYYGENPIDTLAWIRGLDWRGGEVPTEGPRAGRLALDILRHDHAAKREGKSLGDHLGILAAQRPVSACRSFSIPVDMKEFREKVQALSQTFPLLKLKLGSGNLELDVATVAVAREAAPQSKIFVDVNGGWSVDEAVRMIPQLAVHQLLLVEQPVHHSGGLESWRELRRRMPRPSLPLFADESVQNAEDVSALAEYIDGANVKLLKCGSLAETRRMIERARHHGQKILFGCMIESSVGVTTAAHFSPLVDYVDLDGHLYVANDDYRGVEFSQRGEVLLPNETGIGVVPRS